MNSDDFRHFVVVVAGDNPEELMFTYDNKKEVEPYVVYKYSDAAKLKEKYMQMYEAILRTNEISKEERDEIQDEYNDIKDESPNELFFEFTEGYDYDPETGDAISTKNQVGKWSTFNLGKLFCVPFKTTNGDEVYQARVKDIDWSLMHLNNQEVYSRAWEMVIDGSEPQNETEKLIYDNMKNRTVYFQKFGTKENYVVSSTAFWGYAFLSKKTGWVELEDNVSQFKWTSEFYDRFIKPLPKNTLLTLYECTR